MCGGGGGVQSLPAMLPNYFYLFVRLTTNCEINAR